MNEKFKPQDPNEHAIGSFAPGWYYCHCKVCDYWFMGDKRCMTCFECAKARAESKPPEAERSPPGYDAIAAAKMALYNASSLLRALTGPDDAVAQASLKECREAIEKLEKMK